MTVLERQVDFLTEQLQLYADPEKAAPMAAYMKTDMPFYGVQKPQRVQIQRAFKKEFTLVSITEIHALVEALWERPHREEKYLALELSATYKAMRVPASLPLLERLAREGAWWDFVDAIASSLVSPIFLAHRSETTPYVERWSEDERFWIRRLALLAHLKHKAKTDADLLFAHCRKCTPEKEVFIRKAIGWILREYGKAEPERVAQFLVEHRDEWSGLSWREGSRRLKANGWDLDSEASPLLRKS